MSLINIEIDHITLSRFYTLLSNLIFILFSQSIAIPIAKHVEEKKQKSTETKEVYKRSQINKNQKKFGGQQCAVYGSRLSRRVAYFFSSVLSFHPSQSVIFRTFFFFSQKYIHGNVCEVEMQSILMIFLVGVSLFLAPKTRDHSPLWECLFLNRKAG